MQPETGAGRIAPEPERTVIAVDEPSMHYAMQRQARDAFIQSIGVGTVTDSFVVDRGHPDGAEIHSVTDTAVVIIRNQRTGKLITEIIARPEQLRRLYRTQNREVPKRLLKLAYKHNRNRYNEK